ncbi:MAG: hypothetical protein ABEH81_04170 [Halopenitus sp.]
MATQTAQELLEDAAPLFPGDAEDLVEWAEAVADADGKLLADCDLAMETTGVTIDVQERVGPAADVEPGTAQEGWLAIPGFSSECRNCDGDQPIIVLGNEDSDIILFDCINCRTRYDRDGIEGVSSGA